MFVFAMQSKTPRLGWIAQVSPTPMCRARLTSGRRCAVSEGTRVPGRRRGKPPIWFRSPASAAGRNIGTASQTGR